MARSTLDATPVIPPLVISKEDAIVLEQHYLQNQLEVPYILTNTFQTMNVADVPMPENGSKTREWLVEYVLIEQEAPIKLIEKNNGRRSISIDELFSCQIFSWQCYRCNAVFVAIVGNLGMHGGGRKL